MNLDHDGAIKAYNTLNDDERRSVKSALGKISTHLSEMRTKLIDKQKAYTLTDIISTTQGFLGFLTTIEKTISVLKGAFEWFNEYIVKPFTTLFEGIFKSLKNNKQGAIVGLLDQFLYDMESVLITFLSFIFSIIGLK